MQFRTKRKWREIASVLAKVSNISIQSLMNAFIILPFIHPNNDIAHDARSINHGRDGFSGHETCRAIC